MTVTPGSGCERGEGLDSAASLVNVTARRLVVAALCYRVLTTVIAVVGILGSGTLAAGDMVGLATVVALLVLVHALAGLPRWRELLPPRSDVAFAVDIAVAAALSLWAATIIPDGTLFFDYRNPFGGYVVGTLALWTGIRGRRDGAMLLVAFVVPLQLGMAWLDGITPASVDWARFATRSLWLVTAYGVTVLLLGALRRGADALARESELAGRNAQRKQTADACHDNVLGTLSVIVRRARAKPDVAANELADIAALAQECARGLRDTLSSGVHASAGLYVACEQLAAALGQRTTMDVRLIIDGPEPSLDAEVEKALVAAIGEAVRNAERHSGARSLVVTITVTDAEVCARVRDDGSGFDPDAPSDGYGVQRSIRGRLAEVGGSCRLATHEGRGTIWEFTVPTFGGRAERHARQADATTLSIERALRSVAMAPVAYRAGGLLIASAGLIASRSFGPIDLAPLLAIAGLVFGAQLVLMIAARRERLPAVSRRIVAVDVSVAIVLMLWAASTVPAGTVFLDYRDPFTLYAQGTVALWAGYVGMRFGLFLVVLFAVPMQMGAAWLNALTLTSVDWAKLGSRALWFLPALVLAHLVMRAARDGAQLHRCQRERAGHDAERSDAIGVIGCALLERLDEIARTARHPRDDASLTLAQIGEMADSEQRRVRVILNDRSIHAADAFGRRS